MASSSASAAPRPATPLILTALGVAVLATSLAVDPKTAVVGAFAFLLAALIAIRETSTTILTWPNALVGLLLIVWLIPIKQYRLPVTLPFNLELYRLAVVVLMLGFVLGVVTGRLPLTAAGHSKPLVALIAVALVSQIVNWDTLDVPGATPVALKSLSYFLSFVAVFLLVVAGIQRFADATLILGFLVAGGVVVSLAAMIESRTRSNLFSNLDDWVPLFVKETREVEALRGGRLRVRASAQHPIALGVAVTMVVPIALVLARHAASRARSIAFLLAAGICAMGALVTVSRTVVAMAIVMAALGLILRRREVARLWPVLIVLPPVAHAAAPGTLGGLYKSIFPREGLAADLEGRAGLGGSGRLADIDPGLDFWRESPLVGHGLGFVATTANTIVEGATPGATGFVIIFDNQYMATLVMLGALGIAAVLWFVWGAALKLAATARRHREGAEADVVAACAVSCAGFAASMLFFDAFAFVQATLIFFIIAAVGLRLRELGLDKAPLIPLETRRTTGTVTKGVVTE